MNNHYYAVTINNLQLTEKLKTIDIVQDFIKNILKDYEITFYCISRESNEINNNTHYHLLISSNTSLTINDESKAPIWFKEIINEIEISKYLEYIKKDGKYKLYEMLPFEQKNVTWYEKALWASQKYDSLKELFEENKDLIKHINQVVKLWEINNIRERR